MNQTPVQIHEAAPSLSVLDWLRTKSAQRGTKEGCASGDCGACTVVIGAPGDHGVEYRHVNACLMLVGQLHGKHLITVEGLSEPSAQTPEQLHPVQRAMVECHGSQCGFCTPGFIMSMFALYMNFDQCPPRDTVIAHLGGNLCRCTGYRPILDACERMYEYPRSSDTFRPAAQAFFDARQPTPAVMSEGPRQFTAPESLAELLKLRQQWPDARLIAGGTDLSLAFTQALETPAQVISLTDVAELQQMTEHNDCLEIGAAVSYERFLPTLLQHYQEAEEMFHRLGSKQIRHSGTLGGSLGNASPIGDPAPLLLALQADLQLVGPGGSRWVPVSEFFLAYRETVLKDDEVIASVRVPKRRPSQALYCYKISKRIEDDISTVLLVLSFDITDGHMHNVRSGFGGMAAIPMSSESLNAALEGQPLTLDTLEQAGQVLADDFNPMSDVRATRQYRLQVCQNLLLRVGYEQQAMAQVRIQHAAL
ncbi:Xanthine dehydrogenase, iron-sulfur cluster and FAD-binding subunit A [Reinekea sp. MED297]|uniref:Xanthine dehydrogenase, iron-sulfur cluster and FAD-binding subunit A n=1 Tax=Reinekea blandensis MED297 TaxID=314283 RepID=A4BCZ6_9GAMM|nr:Xanthine dehydrogenase, iron-sulfur cluster and FAD-binding subunit A [Reinekea sp. MED297] [Reinekea blandensis MED297]